MNTTITLKRTAKRLVTTLTEEGYQQTVGHADQPGTFTVTETTVRVDDRKDKFNTDSSAYHAILGEVRGAFERETGLTYWRASPDQRVAIDREAERLHTERTGLTWAPLRGQSLHSRNCAYLSAVPGVEVHWVEVKYDGRERICTARFTANGGFAHVSDSGYMQSSYGGQGMKAAEYTVEELLSNAATNGPIHRAKEAERDAEREAERVARMEAEDEVRRAAEAELGAVAEAAGVSVDDIVEMVRRARIP